MMSIVNSTVDYVIISNGQNSKPYEMRKAVAVSVVDFSKHMVQ